MRLLFLKHSDYARGVSRYDAVFFYILCDDWTGADYRVISIFVWKWMECWKVGWYLKALPWIRKIKDWLYRQKISLWVMHTLRELYPKATMEPVSYTHLSTRLSEPYIETVVLESLLWRYSTSGLPRTLIELKMCIRDSTTIGCSKDDFIRSRLFWTASFFDLNILYVSGLTFRN